jgi:hypothetical protein
MFLEQMDSRLDPLLRVTGGAALPVREVILATVLNPTRP